MIVEQPKTKPTLDRIWEFDTGEPIFSDHVTGIVDGKEMIYVLTGNENLIALDRDGKMVWKKRLEKNYDLMFIDSDSIRLPCSSPVFNDGILYVGTLSGKLEAFTGNGKDLWSFRTGGQIKSTPGFDSKGNIYFGSGDGFLYKLDRDGMLKWKHHVGYPIESRIIVEKIKGEERIIFGASDNHVYSFATNGELDWNFRTSGPITGAAGVGDIDDSGGETIIIGSNDSYIYSLSATGDLKWKRETAGNITSDMVVTQVREGKKDIIAGICSHTSNLLLLSGKNNIVDSFDAGFWIASAPIVIDSGGSKKVVFGSYDRNLYLIDFSEGKLGGRIFMYDTGDVVTGRPIQVKGGVVCSNKSGSVLKIRLD